MRFYGGKKHTRKKKPRFGRCDCGWHIDQQPKNERVDNRMYKVMLQCREEYGEEDGIQ